MCAPPVSPVLRKPAMDVFCSWREVPSGICRSIRLSRVSIDPKLAGIRHGAVVFGGHTAVIGWLRSRSDVFHRDVAALQTEGALGFGCSSCRGLCTDDVLAMLTCWLSQRHGGPDLPSPCWSGSHGGRHVWRQMDLPADDSGPGPREYHTLTALSGGRLIAYGGESSGCSKSVPCQQPRF